LRHARLEVWSRGTSFAHRRHPAAKIALALVLLISIATLRAAQWPAACAYFVLLCGLAAAAELPVVRLLRAASVVLPFAFFFALLAALAGEPGRGAAVVVRAWLSALTTVLLMATTSHPDLLAGLEALHAPRFLIQVMQFLYRYMLVLFAEAGAMRDAAASRAGSIGALGFRRAAGAAGVLFARSWARAQATHRAMTARGFEGHIPHFRNLQLRMADIWFFAALAAPVIGIRVTAG